ncbi:MAG: roadblock/LC7 domain-containing protein [Candidatus Hodarchaeales archaeon]|jgi:predicted regulator of Ras-like GTPase activity (Roadblock/LC7/MglB family)
MFDEINNERQEELQETLDKLLSKVPEIKFAVLSSIKGLPICHSPDPTPGDMDPLMISGFAASQISLAEKLLGGLGQSTLSRSYHELEDGIFVSATAGTKAILSIFSAKNVKLGLIFMDVKNSGDRMGKILESE